jgi:hypothetical protein
MNDFEVHPIGTAQRLAARCSQDCEALAITRARQALALLERAEQLRDVGDIQARELEGLARELLRGVSA